VRPTINHATRALAPAHALAAAAILLFGAPGCSDPTIPCVPNLSTNCAPLFDPPTFQALYDNILHPTCASGSGTCHTADAAMGGLVFEDRNTAYQLLLGMKDGRARVLPGNPACSLIMERLESTNPTFRMPPGSMPLSDPQLCTFVKWIASGAMP
jgi:hypothetical protein